YREDLTARISLWKQTLEPFSGSAIVTYHNSWPYFAKCFALTIVGFVEPKPGIPPTPSHIASLVQRMKNDGAGVIIMEPWFSVKTAQSIAQKAGAKVVTLSPSAGGTQGTGSYIDLMSYNVESLAETLGNPGGKR
ncbi:MAG: zinc ABC transporter substrate-binding protein, partial [Chitinispirillaceae bacterium]|nr:zinc ABC transporter substrate-binding protein [Chitinispirillaceae bacterium]